MPLEYSTDVAEHAARIPAVALTAFSTPFLVVSAR